MNLAGLFRLTLRRLQHEPRPFVLLVLCLAVAVFLPWAARLVMGRYEADLRGRSLATPLVVGAPGSRLDLTLDALYFRQDHIDTIRVADYDDLVRTPDALVLPLHMRFTARGYPIVATDHDYFASRELVPVEGTLPIRIGDVVLGAAVARSLGISAGDALFSDQRELYDLARPPALKMRVTGVLGPRGNADDHAVFVPLRTAWILEGYSHGHGDPKTELRPELILGDTGNHIVVSEAMVEYNEVTDENVNGFHFHGDEGSFPLSALLVFPETDKAGTLLGAYLDETDHLMGALPGTVVDELIASVLRVKTLFDLITFTLLVSTGALMVLVMVLSVRLRASERRVLHHIGCSPGTVVVLLTIEMGAILISAVAIAATCVWLLSVLLPSLVEFLR